VRKVRCHKVGLWKTGWRQNASLRFGGADEGVRPYTKEPLPPAAGALMQSAG